MTAGRFHRALGFFHLYGGLDGQRHPGGVCGRGGRDAMRSEARASPGRVDLVGGWRLGRPHNSDELMRGPRMTGVARRRQTVERELEIVEVFAVDDFSQFGERRTEVLRDHGPDRDALMVWMEACRIVEPLL